MYASTTVDQLDALLHQHAHGKGYSPEIFSAEGLVTTRLDPAVSDSARYAASPERAKQPWPGYYPHRRCETLGTA